MKPGKTTNNTLHCLNANALRRCERVVTDAERLDVRTTQFENGARVLDFGTDRVGTLAGGIELAGICLADLASVSVVETRELDYPLPTIQVVTDYPLLACIGGQYAGWPFATERFFSMCSGPARLLRGQEQILIDHGLQSSESQAVGIFEANQIPDENDLAEFAAECGVQPAAVTVCVARTGSFPGTIQVVSRSVETAMHKLHELHFDLRKVRRAIGVAPLPPVSKDDYGCMGWTNDAILFGAEVTLWVDDINDCDNLVDQLPSSASAEFGRPFIEIFERYGRDFYQVDRMLFSPAKVSVSCCRTGRTITAGALRFDLLKASLGWN